jgi:hypothetical protein
MDLLPQAPRIATLSDISSWDRFSERYLSFFIFAENDIELETLTLLGAGRTSIRLSVCRSAHRKRAAPRDLGA